MNDAEFEAMLYRIMKCDFPVREEFKEELLEKCLSVLGDGADGELDIDVIDCRELEDAELDMLAAAGDIFIDDNSTMPSEDAITP